MKNNLVAYELFDLCLGKPSLRSLSISSTISEALSELKQSEDNYLGQIQQQKSSFKTSHEFCCLTQEDIIRFLLSSIGVFSPLPAYPIESLNLIATECLAIGYDEPASFAIDAITLALKQQTSVVVVDNEGKLIGKISPFTLARCEKTVSAAITTPSSGDLMAYIDCGGPSEDIIRLVKSKLKIRNLEGMLSLIKELNFSGSFSFSSSEEELSSSWPTVPLRRSRHSRSRSHSVKMIKRSEVIICNQRSLLVAITIQTLTYKVNYIWVPEDDNTLAGIVRFSDMLSFSGNIYSLD
ncbi:hypothetical protein MKX01_020437 [Papaver californicum]|nr:hypothetical protein MKX01_020437 [Papaver californicum]